ncbi:dehydratase [Acuticoccus sp. M5D2P5]|uniref:MaoC family dehydratase n=1 Tax=Acuticoccus kalidii TaxID=2910977 RepID=UPI001F3FDBC4|nr:MaoC/PaaZ C-terminal domain-containing protein [Acuticoccus kalidii]MCF3935212.1 dehydratase [Acuticoccus kalidii]
MSNFYVKIGDTVSVTKTVGESDVYMYAGITGDLSWNHVNEHFMKKTAYGGRIAHGALMVGFMSTASTLMVEKCGGGVPADETPVSLGYDRVRFIGPVFLGDTITVTYTIIGIDDVKRRSNSEIKITNQRGETVAVANHILKWVPNSSDLRAAE